MRVTIYEEKLEALYASLPTIQCKRKCLNYCGPILISKIEAARLEAKRGHLDRQACFEAAKKISLPAPAILEREYIGIGIKDHCVFLEPMFGYCTVYKMRPLVCRLWGMMDTPLMRCPHGCVPTRWVTDAESKRLHLAVIAIQQEWQKGEKQ
jgi:uncharacterized protein